MQQAYGFQNGSTIAGTRFHQNTKLEGSCPEQALELFAVRPAGTRVLERLQGLELESELQNCCKVRDELLVTKTNTQIGDIIYYETQKNKKIEVDEKIYDMLPKNNNIFSLQTLPFQNKPYKKCAVVGNGGILLNSCCGSEIDQADYVFRFNLPPMNYSYDVGTKTDLVTSNPSILTKRFSKLNERRKPFSDMVKAYGSALIIMPAFYSIGNKDLSFKVYYTLKDFGSELKVFFFHPVYLKNLSDYWTSKGLTAKRLSSGLMLVSSALELCDELTIYGFWPFPEDQEGNYVPHHYYDNRIPKPGFHSMPDEFFFYAQLHSLGALKLKVGRCY
ncbi:alpha-2,8-sialyltransferase 8E-like [Bombina bombina]|uniref:alpha-2,8-sialyltransferase 8E-like n=1 Tax=Bombina bombina TaxID=8345 RepID=UPI00235ADDEE|nr:alpha-2,8-sialyltransferase 8E-like [Bombina bombina]